MLIRKILVTLAPQFSGDNHLFLTHPNSRTISPNHHQKTPNHHQKNEILPAVILPDYIDMVFSTKKSHRIKANAVERSETCFQGFKDKKVKGWHLALMDTEDEIPIEDEKGNGGSNYDRLAAKIPISAGHTACNFKVGLCAKRGFCEDCSFERDFESANSVVFNERLSDPWFKQR
nr:hypothetical protein [Tanacetum cinerariifolium]